GSPETRLGLGGGRFPVEARAIPQTPRTLGARAPRPPLAQRPLGLARRPLRVDRWFVGRRPRLLCAARRHPPGRAPASAAAPGSSAAPAAARRLRLDSRGAGVARRTVRLGRRTLGTRARGRPMELRPLGSRRRPLRLAQERLAPRRP